MSVIVFDNLWIEIAVAAVLLVAIYYSIAPAKPLLATLVEGCHPKPGPTWLFALYETGIVWCAVFLHLPLILFYILIYLSKCLGVRLASRSFTHQLWFFVNMLASHLAVGHLLGLAVLGLWFDKSPYQIYHEPALSLMAACSSLVFTYVAVLILRRVTEPSHLKALADAAVKQPEISWFTWATPAYIMFDSIPCMFDLPYAEVPLFLLGSTLLLLLQLYIFLGYAYRIFVRRHVELEFRALERQQMEHFRRTQALRKLANVDALTHVYSRAYLMKQLHRMLAEKKEFCVTYVDLNGLKYINDTYGHEAGDAYLLATADSLNLYLRPADVLARIGGDEFLVVMPAITVDEAEILMREAALKFEQEPHAYPHSFSFGIVQVAADSSEQAEEVIHRADMVMYKDKKRRKGFEGQASGKKMVQQCV